MRAANEWKKVAVNVQNIKYETAKAVLIAMPHNSDYDGFAFWFPKKLVRDGSHSYECALSVPPDMEIKATRKGKSGAVLAEKVLSVNDLLEAFGEYRGYSKSRKTPKEETVHHTPKALKAEKAEADAALIR